MENCKLRGTLIMVGDKNRSRVYPSKNILRVVSYVKIDKHRDG